MSSQVLWLRGWLRAIGNPGGGKLSSSSPAQTVYDALPASTSGRHEQHINRVDLLKVSNTPQHGRVASLVAMTGKTPAAATAAELCRSSSCRLRRPPSLVNAANYRCDAAEATVEGESIELITGQRDWCSSKGVISSHVLTILGEHDNRLAQT